MEILEDKLEQIVISIKSKFNEKKANDATLLLLPPLVPPTETSI
jgi:hypothetical protein